MNQNILKFSKKREAGNLPIFYESDFPNAATHCEQAECGFSIYRGVLIQWDEDHDERILEFIDQLDHEHRRHLLIAQEHEGCLCLRWDSSGPPEKYKPGRGVEVMGDYWDIL